jgi:hypothetical protein
MVCIPLLVCLLFFTGMQWRTEGGGLGGVQTPPRNSEVLQNRTGLQIEWKMFSVPIPTS